MQIKKIIKQAIKRLEREGKILTPDFYAEAFCKEAKLAGVKVDDCSHVEKMLLSLNPDLQKELKNYRIQTLAELSRYLIAKLNRTDKIKCAEQLDAQTELNIATLKAIALLHNLQARDLAKKTIEVISKPHSTAEVEYFKQLWNNFAQTYDDTFLEKLKPFGTVDTKDLQKTIEGLDVGVVEKKQECDLKNVVSLFISSFTPSISAHVSQNIESLTQKLERNPQALLEDSLQDEIKQAIASRIALDKKSVQEMVESLEGILDKLSNRLINMIEHSDGSTNEIQRIKKELESFTKEGETNFQLAHKKLYTIAIALEENTIEFRSDLEGHSLEVRQLQKRVKELEGELKKAQKEAKIDFLTNLYNKRALDEFLRIREGEFKRYGRNYTVVMFDIDHFKKVNDTYGHEAGDVILKSFASILRRDSRDIDVVGRFGGEEFLAILGDTDADGGVLYAKKVNEHVKRAKFLYKGSRIPITVSAGVAQRKNASSAAETIANADKLLYKAKEEGRDRVVFE